MIPSRALGRNWRTNTSDRSLRCDELNAGRFTPAPNIEMDVINPLIPSAGGPPQILNVPDSRFIIADPCAVTGVGLQNRPCGQDAFVHLPAPDFTGKVEVSVEQCGAAYGDPTRTVIGPVVTTVTVLPPAQLHGQIGGPSAGGAPLPCGVSVEGSGFGINFNGAPAQQDVQVWITGAPVPADQLVPNVLNREQLMPPVTMQTDAAGSIQNLSAFSLNFIPVGATLSALPGIGEAVSITFTGTCASPGPARPLPARSAAPPAVRTKLGGPVRVVFATRHALNRGHPVPRSKSWRDDGTIVEQLFRSGVIKVLVATSTVAAGVNLPARVVIVRDLSLGVDDESAPELPCTDRFSATNR
jgi:hypothetical protein